VSDVPSHRLKQRKRTLRRAVIERRDALDPADRAERSERIAEHVLGLPELRGARTVMAFWSFGSEVETARLLEGLHAAGTRVVLPRVEGDHVVAIVYEPGDEVTATSFGAMEPTGAEVVEPGDVDAVIVPGVAFDRSGHRVGYGGGFYDRFLPRTRAGVPSIAIAFAEQIVDEPVPRGAFDLPVDLIVTEHEVIRAAEDGSR
jgi:5-formyltetrahydrofolate cyclo-ligase